MLEANWFDKENAHVYEQCGFWTCSWPKEPTKIKWNKEVKENYEIAVVTEGYFTRKFLRKLQAKYKIGWIIESKEIRPKAYKKIRWLSRNFDFVLTHDSELVKSGKNFVQVYVGSSRVQDEDVEALFEKKSLVSMIASEKNSTTGHRLRHQIAKMDLDVDLWGRGYKEFESKRDPLASYYYSIAVMNSSYDYYFTEILIDCFIYRTIPIFWGCPSIGEIFNPAGIIQFEELNELPEILDKISSDDYMKRLEAVEQNYMIAKNNFMITDDIIAEAITNHINPTR